MVPQHTQIQNTEHDEIIKQADHNSTQSMLQRNRLTLDTWQWRITYLDRANRTEAAAAASSSDP